MLEAMMRLARTQASGLAEYQLDSMLGRNLEETRLRQLHYLREVESRYPYFFWRPHRIEDDRLQVLASQLQDANTQATLLLSPFVPQSAERGGEIEQAKKRIDDLLTAVDQRLDELDW